jgi:signal peptidase I
MSQTASKPRNARSPAPESPTTWKDSNRDLIEQIVVALILAFLIRGFEAEAFVIPTGSMAPTLMGRHKDLTCPECGQPFQVNASDEVEGFAPNSRVRAATCINCRVPVDVSGEPSFKGDRILVMKFLYSLPFLPGGGGPERWDVVVFKYPEEPETNYIKRLVGLPNEELRVSFGDILTRPIGSDQPFRFERRPLEHQQAMQMLVWNDAHRPRHLAGIPEWARWQPRQAGAWTEAPPSGWGGAPTFTSAPKGNQWAELRYRHLVPDPAQWQAILSGDELPSPPRPTLITDFYSYNSNVSSLRSEDGFEWFQPHWVGDLTLSFQVQPKAPQGKLRIELVEGGVPNRCEIDLATGLATLYHGETRLGEPAPTPLKDTSWHDVTFANVDDRLTLWVDGRTPFGDGLAYSDGSEAHPAPTKADLDPVGIASQGSPVAVSGLVLKRDIYYTQDPGHSDYAGLDLRRADDRPAYTAADRAARLFDALADPDRFAELGRLEVRDFVIRPGHYMMMGDNSPRSKDSRGWGTEDQLRYNETRGWDPNLRESWEVPESLLIGKAFFVYWPHGKPFWPDIALGPDLHVPFRPNVERMKWIR